MSGNLRTTAGDFIVYVRSGIDHVVEHDGDAAANIFFCQTGPGFGAFGVHRHVDHLFVAAGLLHKVGVGIGYHVAAQGRTAVAVGYLDGIQFVKLFFIVNGFYPPFERQVARKHFLHLFHVEVFVDLFHVFGTGNAYGCAGSELAVVLIDLQQSEQRVLFGKFFHALGGLCIGFVLTDLGQQGVGFAGGGIGRSGFGSRSGYRVGRSFVVGIQDGSQNVVGSH